MLLIVVNLVVVLTPEIGLTTPLEEYFVSVFGQGPGSVFPLTAEQQ